MAATVRAFVALDPPEKQRGLLASYLDECRSLAPEYRWVTPEALHLTLRFIGHVPPAQVERIEGELERVRAEPFRLALGGAGVFGSRASPRVVWLSVADGREACAALATGVEAACQAVGLEPEARAFLAHLTLARARSDSARLPALPEAPRLDPWTVDDFVLYESRHRPGDGPRYLELRRFGLAPSASG